VNLRGPIKPEIQGARDFRHEDIPVNPLKVRDASIRARGLGVIAHSVASARCPPPDGHDSSHAAISSGR